MQSMAQQVLVYSLTGSAITLGIIYILITYSPAARFLGGFSSRSLL